MFITIVMERKIVVSQHAPKALNHQDMLPLSNHKGQKAENNILRGGC